MIDAEGLFWGVVVSVPILLVGFWLENRRHKRAQDKIWREHWDKVRRGVRR